ncbi:hypothetical protein BWK58_08295 [Flavobacterium columnare]|nr:hypothetical protein BWK58_08295 [Flavobacterium columnare]
MLKTKYLQKKKKKKKKKKKHKLHFPQTNRSTWLISKITQKHNPTFQRIKTKKALITQGFSVGLQGFEP